MKASIKKGLRTTEQGMPQQTNAPDGTMPSQEQLYRALQATAGGVPRAPQKLWGYCGAAGGGSWSCCEVARGGSQAALSSVIAGRPAAA
jgi:hypothetical protein